jgi:hypothetical protein
MSRQVDNLANDRSIPTEPLLPQPVAQHNHRRMLFICSEAASGSHLQLRDIEVVFRCRLPPFAFRLSARADRRRHSIEVRRYTRERLRLLLHVAVHRRRKVVAA